MHGTNQLRPRESKPGLLQVQDIWPTIQGEGPFSGMPAIFVRLTGCHLACTFCDTRWDDAKDPYLSMYSHGLTDIGILERIHNINYTEGKLFEHKLIVLTGGEPCRQDLGQLIEGLLEENEDYLIQIETAGTFWQDILANPKVTIVCSPKTKAVHPKIMEHCNHWKYVTRHDGVGTDGLPVGSTQGLDNGFPKRPPSRKGVTVWLSPCNEDNETINSINLRAVKNSCMKHGYRAMVQLHRYLEVP